MYDTEAADAGDIAAGIRDTDTLNLRSILQPLSLPRAAHLQEPLQRPLQAPKVWLHTTVERSNRGRQIHQIKEVMVEWQMTSVYGRGFVH